MLALAFIIAGWWGVALFAWQALIAIWQLELTNYIEHYGLTRRYIGDGKNTNPSARIIAGMPRIKRQTG